MAKRTCKKAWEKALEEHTLEDFTYIPLCDIENEGYTHVEEEVEENLRNSTLERVLNTLTERERTVLKLRFFDLLTLEDTGKVISVTKERVRQIEAKALRKMRHPSRSYILKGFIPELYDYHDDYKSQYNRLSEMEEKRRLEIENEKRLEEIKKQRDEELAKRREINKKKAAKAAETIRKNNTPEGREKKRLELEKAEKKQQERERLRQEERRRNQEAYAKSQQEAYQRREEQYREIYERNRQLLEEVREETYQGIRNIYINLGMDPDTYKKGDFPECLELRDGYYNNNDRYLGIKGSNAWIARHRDCETYDRWFAEAMRREFIGRKISYEPTYHNSFLVM